MAVSYVGDDASSEPTPARLPPTAGLPIPYARERVATAKTLPCTVIGAARLLPRPIGVACPKTA